MAFQGEAHAQTRPRFLSRPLRLPGLRARDGQPRVPGQSECGKPAEEGGGCGCGCGCGCSVWVAYTDDGKTLSYTDDADGDGKSDDHRQLPLRSQPRPARRRRRWRGRQLRQLRGGLELHAARRRRRWPRATAATPTSTATRVPNAVDDCPSIPNRDQLDTNANQPGQRLRRRRRRRRHRWTRSTSARCCPTPATRRSTIPAATPTRTATTSPTASTTAWAR